MNQPVDQNPKPEPKPVMFELDGKKLTADEYQKEFEALSKKLRESKPAPAAK